MNNGAWKAAQSRPAMMVGRMQACLCVITAGRWLSPAGIGHVAATAPNIAHSSNKLISSTAEQIWVLGVLPWAPLQLHPNHTDTG